MNMLIAKRRRPANWIKPYFLPFRSSFTKFRPKEVQLYVMVSMEKTRPICVTLRFLEPSIRARTGSLNVRHIRLSDTDIAIVIIY